MKFSRLKSVKTGQPVTVSTTTDQVFDKAGKPLSDILEEIQKKLTETTKATAAMVASINSVQKNVSTMEMKATKIGELESLLKGQMTEEKDLDTSFTTGTTTEDVSGSVSKGDMELNKEVVKTPVVDTQEKKAEQTVTPSVTPSVDRGSLSKDAVSGMLPSTGKLVTPGKTTTDKAVTPNLTTDEVTSKNVTDTSGTTAIPNLNLNSPVISKPEVKDTNESDKEGKTMPGEMYDDDMYTAPVTPQDSVSHDDEVDAMPLEPEAPVEKQGTVTGSASFGRGDVGGVTPSDKTFTGEVKSAEPEMKEEVKQETVPEVKEEEEKEEPEPVPEQTVTGSNSFSRSDAEVAGSVSTPADKSFTGEVKPAEPKEEVAEPAPETTTPDVQTETDSPVEQEAEVDGGEEHVDTTTSVPDETPAPEVSESQKNDAVEQGQVEETEDHSEPTPESTPEPETVESQDTDVTDTDETTTPEEDQHVDTPEEPEPQVQESHEDEVPPVEETDNHDEVVSEDAPAEEDSDLDHTENPDPNPVEDTHETVTDAAPAEPEQEVIPPTTDETTDQDSHTVEENELPPMPSEYPNTDHLEPQNVDQVASQEVASEVQSAVPETPVTQDTVA